jgi:hypothetical protein
LVWRFPPFCLKKTKFFAFSFTQPHGPTPPLPNLRVSIP